MAAAPRERRPLRGLLAGVMVGLAIVLAPVAASALWQATTTSPSAPISAGSLATPSAVCNSVPAGANPAYVQLTWGAITGADSYTITLRNSTGSVSSVQATGVTALSYDLKGNLVSNLGVLLTTLLGGGAIYVTVTAVNNSWASSPSAGNAVVLSSVLGGLLGGLKCQ